MRTVNQNKAGRQSFICDGMTCLPRIRTRLRMNRLLSVILITVALASSSACSGKKAEPAVTDSSVNIVFSEVPSGNEGSANTGISGDPAGNDPPADTLPGAAPDLYPPDANGINIDLTQMSSTMVFSQVYSMTLSPDEYVGLKIRMNGLYNYYRDEASGNEYHACLILDATACCAQGIEFELTDNGTCPKQGDEITVTGTFDTYTEGSNTYCILRNAVLEN